MDLGLTDKVVMVTGASGGIGSVVVAVLAEEGAFPVGVDMVPAPDVCIVSDLSAPETAESCVTDCIARFGRIDGLIHCAGISRPQPLSGTDDATWNSVLDVNLSSFFRICRAAERALTESTGSVASIASFAGKRGTLFGDNASYTVSKAGVIGLTHALALEWAPRGIRVNAVAPGPVDTPMLRELPMEKRDRIQAQVPLGRLPSPRDVADALVFLISARATSITGEIMDVNGGLYLD